MYSWKVLENGKKSAREIHKAYLKLLLIGKEYVRLIFLILSCTLLQNVSYIVPISSWLSYMQSQVKLLSVSVAADKSISRWFRVNLNCSSRESLVFKHLYSPLSSGFLSHLNKIYGFCNGKIFFFFQLSSDNGSECSKSWVHFRKVCTLITITRF